jgi:hypothetical protein
VRYETNADGTVSDKPAIFNPKEPVSKTLIDSFYEVGYNPEYPISVSEITPELAQKAREGRSNYWNQLKLLAASAGTSENRARLAIFTFFCTKADELIDVPYYGTTGNRRSECIVEACVRRIINAVDVGLPHVDGVVIPWGKEVPAGAVYVKCLDAFDNPGKYLDGLIDIPVNLLAFESDTARTMYQIMENGQKKTGFKALSDLEVLRVVRPGVQCGRISQKELRDKFKAGEGQRMHGFLMVDGMYPSINMFNRVFLPETNPDCIVWKKLPQGEDGFWTMLKGRANVDSLEEFNAKLIAKGEQPVTLMSPEDVDIAIRDKMRPGARKPNGMSRERQEGVANVNPNEVVKGIVKSIMKDDTSFIEKVSGMAPSFNALLNLGTSPNYPLIQDILVKAAALKDVSAVETILKATVVALDAALKVPVTVATTEVVVADTVSVQEVPPTATQVASVEKTVTETKNGIVDPAPVPVPASQPSHKHKSRK